jgi:hypothetical protein
VDSCWRRDSVSSLKLDWLNYNHAPGVDTVIVKYLYALEDHVGWFDAFAPTFGTNGDDHRAVPEIVRSMESAEGEPDIPRRMLVSLQATSEGRLAFVSSPVCSEVITRVREFADRFRNDHSRSIVCRLCTVDRCIRVCDRWRCAGVSPESFGPWEGLSASPTFRAERS